MKKEPTAQQISEHSHDEMYLVYHHTGKQENGIDYMSCHHCGFIKVPLLEEVQRLYDIEKLRSEDRAKALIETCKVRDEIYHKYEGQCLVSLDYLRERDEAVKLLEESLHTAHDFQDDIRIKIKQFLQRLEDGRTK